MRHGRENVDVRFLLLLGFVLFFTVQGLNMGWQPRFAVYFTNKAMLGWFWAVMSLTLLLGSTIARWFLKRFYGNDRCALLAVQILVGINMLFAGWGTTASAVITFFLLHEVARGMYRPLKDAYLNRDIPSHERATILSFEAMSNHIGALLGLLLNGIVTQYTSISVGWMIAGFLLTLFAGTGLLVFRNGRREP